MYSAAFAHTVALSSVQPVRRQAKPAHTDFDLCHHTATRSPSVLFKWSSRIKYIIQKVKNNISKNYTKIGHRAWRNYLTCWLWPLKLHILPTNYDIELLAKNWSVCLQHKYDTHTHTHTLRWQAASNRLKASSHCTCYHVCTAWHFISCRQLTLLQMHRHCWQAQTLLLFLHKKQVILWTAFHFMSLRQQSAMKSAVPSCFIASSSVFIALLHSSVFKFRIANFCCTCEWACVKLPAVCTACSVTMP